MGFPSSPDTLLTAPLVLPAEPGKPLTTQDGITLADGSGNIKGVGDILSTANPANIGTIGNASSRWRSFNVFAQIAEGPSGQPVLQLFDSGAVIRAEFDGNFDWNLPYGGVILTGGSRVSSGTGAPTIAGTAGDFFFRTDTPTTADQRIYVCTVTGGAGAATWVGIV